MRLSTPSATAAEIARLAELLAERATRVEAHEPLRLAGSKEASRLLDVGYDTFHTLRKRGQVPTPVAELACGPVWRVEDLETWKRVEAAGNGR